MGWEIRTQRAGQKTKDPGLPDHATLHLAAGAIIFDSGS
jgi:hypothetical protein